MLRKWVPQVFSEYLMVCLFLIHVYLEPFLLYVNFTIEPLGIPPDGQAKITFRVIDLAFLL